MWVTEKSKDWDHRAMTWAAVLCIVSIAFAAVALVPSFATATLSTGTTRMPTLFAGPGTLEDTATTYLVAYYLNAASEQVGALQWSTNYTATVGEFQGSGASTVCPFTVPGALFGTNDNDAARSLTLFFISLTGVQAPGPIARCVFKGVTANAPTSNQLPIQIQDATDTNGDPISVAISLSITEVSRLCGNGFTEGQEECDDGNSVNSDACTDLCLTAACGDSYVWIDNEQCDYNNPASGSQCDSHCKLTGCGNGTVGSGEQCDDGNSIATDACTNSCKTAKCGDGFVRTGIEECDDGNTVSTDSCTQVCHTAKCGDGFLRAGVEECDDGNIIDSDGCTSDCVVAICGDGIVRGGLEQCDDANSVETDACLSNCKAARCGDGIVQASVETCDDGNNVNTDSCPASCKPAICGDGFVHGGVESCDDGNTANTDSCISTCTPATCGDGFVRSGVEQCDDANGANGDGCDINCKTTACGNGIATEGEQCDDGNTVNSDACLYTCSSARCGDGFIHSGLEECDDGGLADGDGCSHACEVQRLCGDATGDNKIFASDALRILQRSVGTDVECPTWICDVDDNGSIGASDALKILKRSVDLPAVLNCGTPTSLVIRITTVAAIGSLQFDIDYDTVSGEIDGSGSSVDCETLQPDVESVFNDKPTRVLAASFVSLSGIFGPGTLARCSFLPSANVDPDDFVVTVLDVKDRSGNSIAKPGVKVIPD